MKLDKTIRSNKLLKSFFTLKIKSFFGTTPAENLIFPVTAVLASGIICRNIAGNTHWLEITAAAVMLLSWVLSSLLSGFLKRWYFILLSGGINLLPYLFFNAAETNPSDINEIFVLISEFTVLYSAEPILNLGITAFNLSVTITAASAVLMVLGFIIRKNARSSKEYCKVRLSMLSKGAEN